MTAEKEYRKIVEGYDAARKREFSRFATYPSFRSLVGNISGQDVLDVGCGAGFSARILNELGARKIVGVDITPEQIALARKYEEETPLGIDYRVADIARTDLREFGRFDLATSVHCINHCNLEELTKAIQNIGRALKPKGRFVGVMTSPGLTAEGSDSYGIKYSFPKGFGDGKPVHAIISSFEGHKFCELTEHYYSFETFRKLFEKAGLSINWFNPQVTEEGMKERGREFWQDLMIHPPVLIYEAVRK